MALPFQFLIDTAQDRLSLDSLNATYSGLDWDVTYSSNIYIDGVTYTAFLMPGAAEDAWQTSNSGIYTKLGRSDFTLSDSSNWLDHNADTGGPFYFYSTENSSGVSGKMTASLPTNQPMVIEWFQDQSTTSAADVIECGWSSTGDGTAGVSLRFYSNGKAEVWKDGVIQGRYSIQGKTADYYRQGQSALDGAAGSIYMKVMLIPCRGRELLVLGSGGGGFSHVFSDIPEGEASPTITSASPFWFYVPDPFPPVIRISKLQHESSGTLVSLRGFWRYDPDGQTGPTVTVYQDATAPSATGTVKDGVNPTNPYSNNTNGFRLSLALSGGPTSTPFVYGARAEYEQMTESTPEIATDVTSSIESINLSWTDSSIGLTGTVNFFGPDALSTLGVPAIGSQNRRPARALVNGEAIGSLVLGAPKTKYLSGFDATGADRNSIVTIPIADTLFLAGQYVFSDPIPFDGMTLKAAFTLVCTMMGLQCDVSDVFDTFTIPTAGSPCNNGWNMSAQVGDKGNEWLERFHSTYAADAFLGTDGDGKVIFLDQTDLPSAPALTLYDTIQGALDGGHTDDEAYKFVFRSFDRQVIEPEANDVYVVGRDFRTQKTIVVHKEDSASIDPTLAPGDRPDNWLGGRVKFSYENTMLTSEDACTWAMDRIFPKVTSCYPLITFECDFHAEIYRGQMVQLQFKDGSTLTARIKTVNCRIDMADPNASSWMPATYTAEEGSSAWTHHTTGKTLKEIAAQIRLERLRRRDRQRNFDMNNVIARPIGQQTEA